MLALAAGLVMACGSNGGASPSGGHPTQSNQPPPGTPYRASTTQLARGVVAALPAGTVFISVSDLSAQPGAVVKSPSTPGILYVIAGAAGFSGAAPTQLKTGEAAFLPPGQAVANPGTSSAEWYFIAVQPAADRGGQAPLAGATRIFATDDLPPLPQINQAEALERTTLQGGGQSEAYRPNGVEVLLGIDGTAEVRADALHGPAELSRGKVAFVLEGSALQIFNPASAPAAVLSFFVLPDGSPLTRSSN